MNRRRLFQTLAAAALGYWVRPTMAQPTANNRILLQTSELAGFQHHEGEKLWQQLQPGQSLQLIREPNNKYDRNAIRVDWRGRKLGYVPRRENITLAQMLDRNQCLSARISALQESHDPWQRIQLTVELG